MVAYIEGKKLFQGDGKEMYNTAMCVSKAGKLGAGNVSGIDTRINVCINCVANAEKSSVCENKDAKSKIGE